MHPFPSSQASDPTPAIDIRSEINITDSTETIVGGVRIFDLWSTGGNKFSLKKHQNDGNGEEERKAQEARRIEGERKKD